MELSMVTIKIQGKEDIIEAYLRSLGFDGKQLLDIVETIAEHIDFKSGNGDELVAKLDGVLLKLAAQTFPNSGFADEQLLAEFKLCFLLCNAADSLTVQDFKQLKMPEKLVKTLRECFVLNAPAYDYSEMKPQKLEVLGAEKEIKK